MRNASTVSGTTSGTLTVTLLALLAAFVPGTVQAGAPLKGVDVKLGKAPGGGASARTTDDLGKFDFGVVPRGTYILSAALHDDPWTASRAGAAARGTSPSNSAAETCVIQINGAAGGPMVVVWDLKTRRVATTATQSTARGGPAREIVVNSDGQHPLNGTIVRANSNISNN